MNAHTLINHPIQNFLAAHPADFFPEVPNVIEEEFIEINSDELERLMYGEEKTPTFTHDPSLGEVRVASRATPLLLEKTEVTGTLTSRIFALADDTEGCATQAEWREKIKQHPAYSRVFEEIFHAHCHNNLTQIFDRLEGVGCEVYFNKATAELTLGLNLKKMRKGFGEHIKLKDIRNKKALNMVNDIGHLSLALKEPEAEVAEMITPTFFLTLQLSNTI